MHVSVFELTPIDVGGALLIPALLAAYLRHDETRSGDWERRRRDPQSAHEHMHVGGFRHVHCHGCETARLAALLNRRALWKQPCTYHPLRTPLRDRTEVKSAPQHPNSCSFN